VLLHEVHGENAGRLGRDERSALLPGKPIDGPALVAELQTTTIVPEGARFWIDEFANLRIALETIG
jgi:N-methylhydantoinase A/oxoprolinase/acetone carboxylase beta subunit